ncbi:NAD-dependent epimerase/dehydratase family protein [Cyanobium sp. ATX 6F1]|uniref:NAD-dependent epimerase/dehydratase family protein n=1 Tax=unclassified Cyanobium TaxID=2627006 RepID=UPI0020CCD077|nr:NAD-dependent epimerase/dehydratase family protein [Cyanobium sp. ATX 6F1]MCP9916648.1 NAD(P)-dependent oxidoreductase [Cyanobium sp. ATX 6F1]
MEGLIAVTGATGWFGRTAIDELQKIFSPEEFKLRVRAFASRAGSLQLPGGFSLPVQPLEALPMLARQETIGGILHCAFLTPDRLQEVGEEAYVSTNRQITEWVVKALEASPSTRVVEISSGAAKLVENEYVEGNGRLSTAQRLYGSLKLEEERLLVSIAPTMVLRIYALSGRWMRDPKKYALGDFLLQAAAGKRIVVKSSHPVIRGYGNAGDIAKLSIGWLFIEDTPPLSPVATVNAVVDLANLAEIVSNCFNLPAPILHVDPDSKPDIYSASSVAYRSLANVFRVNLCSIEGQVIDSAVAMSILRAA